jgi:hypothetical protein
MMIEMNNRKNKAREEDERCMEHLFLPVMPETFPARAFQVALHLKPSPIIDRPLVSNVTFPMSKRTYVGNDVYILSENGWPGLDCRARRRLKRKHG